MLQPTQVVVNEINNRLYIEWSTPTAACLVHDGSTVDWLEHVSANFVEKGRR